MTARAGARPGATSSEAETFGDRLRRLREEAGLTQSALAGDRLHPSYVSLLEAGRRSPTRESVELLAQRLGVTPAQLLGEVDAAWETPLALAEAALGLGKTRDALDLLEPHLRAVTVESVAGGGLHHRLGLTYATALERSGRPGDAVPVLETLAAGIEAAHGALPWLPTTVALVRCYRDSGDLARAIDVGEAARARCAGVLAADHQGHAALVSTLASAYGERGDLLRAQILLDELLERPAAGTDLDEQACALWNRAIVAAERGDAVAALDLSEQASTLLGLGNNLRARALLQVSRAWIQLAQRPPQAEEAREALREAMPHVRQHAGAMGIASAETELARAELLLGRPEVARRHATSALTRLGDDYPLERARALVALGAAVLELTDRAEGADLLEEAAGLLRAGRAGRQCAAVWRQLCEVYRSLGDFERAMVASDHALDCAGLAREAVVDVTASATRTGRRRRVPAGWQPSLVDARPVTRTRTADVVLAR